LVLRGGSRSGGLYRRFGSNPAVAAAGRPIAALGRRLPFASPMNERLLIDVGHPKPAIPLSASTCHSAGCLNVREGSRPAVRGK